MKKRRYTIIETDGWGNIEVESDNHTYAVYDLVTECIAELEGTSCTNLSQADAAMVVARLEGCP